MTQEDWIEFQEAFRAFAAKRYPKMNQDPDTWLRASAWALWKATFELCALADHQGREAALQMTIIDDVMNI